MEGRESSKEPTSSAITRKSSRDSIARPLRSTVRRACSSGGEASHPECACSTSAPGWATWLKLSEGSSGRRLGSGNRSVRRYDGSPVNERGKLEPATHLCGG